MKREALQTSLATCFAHMLFIDLRQLIADDTLRQYAIVPEVAREGS